MAQRVKSAISSSVDILDGIEEDVQRELYTQLAHKFASGKRDLTARDIETWDALCDALAINARARQPLGAFITSHGVAKWRQQCDILHDYVTDSCSAGLRLPHRLNLLRLVIKSLARYLCVMHIPPTPGTIMSHLTLLGYAVDQDFPGYASSKLLQFASRVSA